MRAVLGDIVVGNEKAKEELFIEAFKMFQKADDNKEEFRKILIAYLRGDTKALWNSGENTAWLDKMFPRMFTGGNRETWLARNERVIDAGKASKVDVSKSIEHFLEVANRKLETLGLEPKGSAGDLLQYFDATLKKEKGSLREKSVNSEEFDTLFADLSLQVQSIKGLMRQGKAREITQVKIYRETNPMRTLMMGNWVDGSCLSFYSTVGNFWSTAVNALDANKAVFYIEDQAGNIIGRVLTAIDNNGNLLRFRTYTKGNIGIDLDAFINPYLRDIAERAGLGLNGNISQVELLHGTQWYQDPVQAM